MTTVKAHRAISDGYEITVRPVSSQWSVTVRDEDGVIRLWRDNAVAAFEDDVDTAKRRGEKFVRGLTGLPTLPFEWYVIDLERT